MRNKIRVEPPPKEPIERLHGARLARIITYVLSLSGSWISARYYQVDDWIVAGRVTLGAILQESKLA